MTVSTVSSGCVICSLASLRQLAPAGVRTYCTSVGPYLIDALYKSTKHLLRCDVLFKSASACFLIRCCYLSQQFYAFSIVYALASQVQNTILRCVDCLVLFELLSSQGADGLKNDSPLVLDGSLLLKHTLKGPDLFPLRESFIISLTKSPKNAFAFFLDAIRAGTSLSVLDDTGTSAISVNHRFVNIPVGKGIKRVEFHQSFAFFKIFYSWKYSADSNQKNQFSKSMKPMRMFFFSRDDSAVHYEAKNRRHTKRQTQYLFHP